MNTGVEIFGVFDHEGLCKRPGSERSERLRTRASSTSATLAKNPIDFSQFSYSAGCSPLIFYPAVADHRFCIKAKAGKNKLFDSQSKLQLFI